MELLNHYTKFVEWSTAQTPGQGKFLIPEEKFVKQLTFENTHPDECYTCTANEKLAEDQKKKENEIMKDKKICTQNFAENKSPFIIGLCELQEVPCIEIAEAEPEPECSSLSSFEFDNTKYASLKVSF